MHQLSSAEAKEMFHFLNNMIIEVHVTTNAKKKQITKMSKRHFRVSLISVPDKGKANKELLSLLSEHFNTAKSNISIIKGMSSKNKVIEISTL